MHFRSFLRKLFDLICYLNETSTEAAVLSLHTEKAFDSLETPLLMAFLYSMGFGETFLIGIQAIYNSPRAQIKVNGLFSSNIILARGTRQGCPLSPVLFALAVEPLTEDIRQNDCIKGPIIAGGTHKINLFADNMALFVMNLGSLLLAVQGTLDVF